MFLENIFTNLWSNIIVLLVFVVLMAKVFYEQYLLKKSIKLKIKDIFPMVFLGIGFIVGVIIISFAVTLLEKMVNSFVLILFKILLYLVLAYALNKLWKGMHVKGGE